MKHAVVIGAAMAGLAAACALAAHVEQVTVLERDRPADTAAQRHSTLARRRRFTGMGCWRLGCTSLSGHEAPGEVHTLVVDPDVTEMTTMFKVNGAMIHVDPDGAVTGFDGMFTRIDKCRRHYAGNGLGAACVGGRGGRLGIHHPEAQLGQRLRGQLLASDGNHRRRHVRGQQAPRARRQPQRGGACAAADLQHRLIGRQQALQALCSVAT